MLPNWLDPPPPNNSLVKILTGRVDLEAPICKGTSTNEEKISWSVGFIQVNNNCSAYELQEIVRCTLVCDSLSWTFFEQLNNGYIKPWRY